MVGSLYMMPLVILLWLRTATLSNAHEWALLNSCLSVDFLKKAEMYGFTAQGGRPPKNYGDGGVKIGIGIDLSRRKECLESLHSESLILEDIYEKIEPFIGLTKVEAKKQFQNLMLTEDEALELSYIVFNKLFWELLTIYNSHQEGNVTFQSLTKCQRTVIFSIFFEFGEYPENEAIQDFYDAVYMQDWEGAITSLRAYRGARYMKVRKTEERQYLRLNNDTEECVFCTKPMCLAFLIDNGSIGSVAKHYLRIFIYHLILFMTNPDTKTAYVVYHYNASTVWTFSDPEAMDDMAAITATDNIPINIGPTTLAVGLDEMINNVLMPSDPNCEKVVFVFNDDPSRMRVNEIPILGDTLKSMAYVIALGIPRSGGQQLEDQFELISSSGNVYMIDDPTLLPGIQSDVIMEICDAVPVPTTTTPYVP